MAADCILAFILASNGPRDLDLDLSVKTSAARVETRLTLPIHAHSLLLIPREDQLFAVFPPWLDRAPCHLLQPRSAFSLCDNLQPLPQTFNTDFWFDPHCSDLVFASHH